MKKVRIDNLKPGMVLAVDIRVESSDPEVTYLIRIERDTVLEEEHIEKLRDAGPSFVLVQQETTEPEEIWHDQAAERIRDDAVDELQKIRGWVRADVDDFDFGRVELMIEELIDRLRDCRDVLKVFGILKSREDYTIRHSLEVSTLSLSMALAYPRWFSEHVSEGDVLPPGTETSRALRELGLGTLLHDVGKWRIPDEILSTTRPLSEHEWSAIKQHPERGRRFLEDHRENITLEVLEPVFQHHEKFRGGGYPDGLSGDQIHFFSRITTCCDVFAALTSPRPYRVKVSPKRALDEMKRMQRRNTCFDPEVFQRFLELMLPYPVGQSVILSNGARGRVSDLAADPKQPIVEVEFEGLRRLDEPYSIRANTSSTPDIVN